MCNRYNPDTYYHHWWLLCLPVFLIFFSCQSGNKPADKSQKNLSLAPPAANEDYFQEIGKQIGLDFVHSIGDKDLTNIIE